MGAKDETNWNFRETLQSELTVTSSFLLWEYFILEPLCGLDLAQAEGHR